MSKTDEDTFYDLKKDELILLAEHLELEVRKAIQHIIVKLLVNVKAFKETMLETMSETYGAYDVEMKQLQFELDLKKLEMQERLKWEEKERQERMEEKEQRERLEKRDLALQHELEMKKLEVQMKLGLDFNSEKSSEKFDVAKYI